MTNSEIINTLLYDYDGLTENDIRFMCKSLPRKLVRWIGINHPDNRTRKIFYELTTVEIGEGTVINIKFIVLDSYEHLLKIGKNVAISPNVTVICDSNPNNSDLNAHPYINEKLRIKLPVEIKDNAWIGTNAVILPGITIGEGSIIGAGSVVTTNIPPRVIAAGIPCKVIRKL